jgi:F0F1-type ATP synthase assembly protein I
MNDKIIPPDPREYDSKISHAMATAEAQYKADRKAEGVKLIKAVVALMLFGAILIAFGLTPDRFHWLIVSILGICLGVLLIINK